MRNTFLVILFVIASISLFGCGGGGGGTSSDVSIFHGTFAGSWEATDGDVGTANIVISNSGQVSGSIHDTTANLDGTIHGQVGSDGHFAGGYIYPGNQQVTGTGTFTISDGDNTLTGVVTSGSNSATYVLDRQ